MGAAEGTRANKAGEGARLGADITWSRDAKCGEDLPEEEDKKEEEAEE